MFKKKKKKEWPEHTSWWDRNEFKMNVILWTAFFGLLITARGIFTNKQVNFEAAVIWLILFLLNLFLLSFTSNTANN